MTGAKHKITISFGSNLGDKKRNIQSAYSLLQQRLGNMLNCSNYYETKPWGFESEESFINSCAIFQTDKNPFECLEIINDVEKELGRVRFATAGYEDRLIDIDIIFYDKENIDTQTLKIPHPLWQVRDFVVIPLKDMGILKY
ncbi:MAG: 2-amino-4-hydroxy-6-hydroxymethyldihydropteridine diphosphokinase [Bacteroidales bacterium]